MPKTRKTVRASQVNALNRKADRAWKDHEARKPGKVVRVHVSGLGMMFNDEGRYEVKVRREHSITRTYHIRADSEAIAMLDHLILTGALTPKVSMYAYPTWIMERTADDLALEAMGND